MEWVEHNVRVVVVLDLGWRRRRFHPLLAVHVHVIIRARLRALEIRSLELQQHARLFHEMANDKLRLALLELQVLLGLEAVLDLVEVPRNQLGPAHAVGILGGRLLILVVVGGRNSANTARLFMSAKASGKPSWHIETASELPDGIFGYGKVGLSAGASTPDALVEEVEARLLEGRPRPACKNDASRRFSRCISPR